MHRVAAQRLERRDERRLHCNDLVAKALRRLAADTGIKPRVDDQLDIHILELVADGHVVRRVVREHGRLDDDSLDAGVARALERIGVGVGRDDGDELQLRDLTEEHGVQQTLQFCSLAGNQNSAADHMLDYSFPSSRAAVARLLSSCRLSSSVRRRSSSPLPARATAESIRSDRSVALSASNCM